MADRCRCLLDDHTVAQQLELVVARQTSVTYPSGRPIRNSRPLHNERSRAETATRSSNGADRTSVDGATPVSRKTLTANHAWLRPLDRTRPCGHALDSIHNPMSFQVARVAKSLEVTAVIVGVISIDVVYVQTACGATVLACRFAVLTGTPVMGTLAYPVLHASAGQGAKLPSQENSSIF